MKKLATLLGFLAITLLGLSLVIAAPPKDRLKATDQEKDDGAAFLPPIPPPELIPFRPGERFEYLLKWKGFSGGRATLKLGEDFLEGEPVLRISWEVRTTGLINKFFHIEDALISLFSPDSFCSLQFEQHLREGKYTKDEVTFFDLDTQEARRTNLNHPEKNETVSIPGCVLDTLSSIFFIRTQPLEIGKTFAATAHNRGKNYPLLVEVQRREKIKGKLGRFQTLKIEPKLPGRGLFSEKGRMWIWYTDDERRLPVVIKGEMKIGKITAKLIHYDPGRVESDTPPIRAGQQD